MWIQATKIMALGGPKCTVATAAAGSVSFIINGDGTRANGMIDPPYYQTLNMGDQQFTVTMFPSGQPGAKSSQTFSGSDVVLTWVNFRSAISSGFVTVNQTKTNSEEKSRNARP